MSFSDSFFVLWDPRKLIVVKITGLLCNAAGQNERLFVLLQGKNKAAKLGYPPP